MKMCDDEEKLDAIIGAFEAGAGSKQDKVNKIVDEYMDFDGDGNITMEEVCKFFGFLEGKECTPDDVADTPDLKDMVGKSAAEAKALIMKMCDDEEKLDGIIGAFAAAKNGIATKEDKVNKIVDECMYLDGDGNITMEEVCKFFGFLEGKECTPDDVADTPDLKDMVGKSAAEAKALIMKMCDDEEKLDGIIGAFAAAN